MPTPTVLEYDEAGKLLSLYRKCAYCHQIFPSRDKVVITGNPGEEKFWCAKCWPKVKDD